MDIVDKNSNLAPSGPVTLGGGWIETEFDDLVVTSLEENALNDVAVSEYGKVVTPQEKESLRKQQRATYTAVKVGELKGSRTDISLDGNWLFMPEYELNNKENAVALGTDDKIGMLCQCQIFGIRFVSGYMARQCHHQQDISLRECLTHIISRKRHVAKVILLTIEKQTQLGIVSG